MILSLGHEASMGMAALVLALLAVLAYGVALAPGATQRGLGSYALLAGWLLHAVVLVLDISGSGGGGARLGFAPVLSLTVWLVLAVHAVESRFVPLPAVRRVLAVTGALAVLLAWAFPGEVRPLAGSPWAPLHFVLGVASYGLFGAAVLHGAMLDAAERRLRPGALASSGVIGGPGALSPGGHGPGGMPLLRLERLTFRFVEAGFVVLTLALALGVLTSPVWKWNHKTIFSILAWLVFAHLLAGRLLRGWRGRRATRWLYAGAALLLLAYVGYHFVYEVLLGRPAA